MGDKMTGPLTQQMFQVNFSHNATQKKIVKTGGNGGMQGIQFSSFTLS
jgi:hypothetical protein